MNRITRPVVVAAAIGAVLLGSACGGASAPATQAGSPAAASSSAVAEDPTAWADSVCGSAQKFTDAATKQPQINPTDPQAAISTLSTYLGSVITGVDDAIAGIRAAGPAPVDGGDQVATKLIDALSSYKNTFQQAKSSLDTADPNDPTALASAVAPLQNLANTPNPLAGLQSSPELDQAARQAPNCQALARVGQQLGGAAGGQSGTGGG